MTQIKYYNFFSNYLINIYHFLYGVDFTYSQKNRLYFMPFILTKEKKALSCIYWLELDIKANTF